MHLQTEIWLPAAQNEVFAFFARAENLQALTPDWLHFRILTGLPIDLRLGTLIDYRIRIHGVPLSWQSEISVWDPPRVFVDEQRRGPYKRWIHTHRFAEERGGTRVRDEVDFAVPGGFLAAPFVTRESQAHLRPSPSQPRPDLPWWRGRRHQAARVASRALRRVFPLAEPAPINLPERFT